MVIARREGGTAADYSSPLVLLVIKGEVEQHVVAEGVQTVSIVEGMVLHQEELLLRGGRRLVQGAEGLSQPVHRAAGEVVQLHFGTHAWLRQGGAL